MEGFFVISILDNIGQFLINTPLWGYIILGLVFIVRGETAILLSVFLVMKGYISWATLAAVAILSIMIGDNFIYAVGRLTTNTKLSFYLEKKLPFLKIFRSYLHRHFIKIVLIVKYTVGLTLITMLSAGWAGIPFRRFFFWHALGISVWTLVMSVLGYSLISGLGYLETQEILGRIEIWVLVVIALFIAIEFVIQRFIKSASRREATMLRIGKVIEKARSYLNGKNKDAS